MPVAKGLRGSGGGGGGFNGGEDDVDVRSRERERDSFSSSGFNIIPCFQTEKFTKVSMSLNLLKPP